MRIEPSSELQHNVTDTTNYVKKIEMAKFGPIHFSGSLSTPNAEEANNITNLALGHLIRFPLY